MLTDWLIINLHCDYCTHVFSQPCAAQSSLKDMNWDQEQWKPLICKYNYAISVNECTNYNIIKYCNHRSLGYIPI